MHISGTEYEPLKGKDAWIYFKNTPAAGGGTFRGNAELPESEEQYRFLIFAEDAACLQGARIETNGAPYETDVFGQLVKE